MTRVKMAAALCLGVGICSGQLPSGPDSDLPSRNDLLDPFVVEGTRRWEWAADGGYSGQRLDREKLRKMPERSLDAKLAGRDGFRLFRRDSSNTAHPTAQSPAFRVAGPNGASRALVYKDGIPLNDPFGGWVAWSSLPPLAIASAELAPGGGLDPWGNATLGGSLWLESRGLREVGPFWSWQVESGETLDHAITSVFAWDSPDGRHRFFGSALDVRDGGAYVVHEDQRGAVDVRADLESRWAELGWRFQGGGPWSVMARAEVYEDERGNGTPLAGNGSRFILSSLGLTREREADWAFHGAAYYHLRDFRSRFTSVADDRNRELPVLDQYEVPSEAAGFLTRTRYWLGEKHEVDVLADGRWSAGETNERFRNLGEGFTRERRAGGDRLETGVGLQHRWKPAGTGSRWHLHSGLRLDYVRDQNGFLEEIDLSEGRLSEDLDFEDRNRWEWSGRLGVSAEVTSSLLWRAAVYMGSRRPTLNELYRPFRVGNDITLANPALDSERLWGGEMGFDWDLSASLQVGLEFYHSRLEDGVANVKLVDGPGVIPPFGFIPDGGTGGRRLNLDRIDIHGMECGFEWEPIPSWTLGAGYLYTRAVVIESQAQPELEGNRLAQVPSHQAFAQLLYDAGGAWRAGVHLRWVGEAFDDNLNLYPLDGFLKVDLSLGWRVSEGHELYVSVENLFDETIETRRGADGIVDVGEPRRWRIGYAAAF